MKKLTEPLTVEISFSLPQWFPQERFDYTNVIRYPTGHVYAGSYDSSTYENSATDALFKLGDVKELCPYYWVSFEISASDDIPAGIAKIERKLHNFLKRYKEAKE